MTDVTKPVTLADLNRDGKLAWVYCNACGRERDVPPARLGLPLETPVPEAGKRLVCSACGGRNVTVKPLMNAHVVTRPRSVFVRVQIVP